MGSHDPFGYFKHKLWPKENWESNCQFDSRPLKVKNRFDFLPWRWLATYHWKDLNEGYNFALELISIRGLHTKLWASKITWVPILRISGLPFGSPGTKWHLGASPMARHKEYYKGGRWWLHPNPSRGESCESMFAHGLSMHQKCFNYALINLLFGMCKSMWTNELLVAHLSPIPEL